MNGSTIPRLKFPEKFGFFTFSTASNVVYQFKSIYYLFFLTNVLKIDVLAAGAVDLAFLRCPGCGRSIAIGDWRAGKSYRCRRCGSLYLFDAKDIDAIFSGHPVKQTAADISTTSKGSA